MAVKIAVIGLPNTGKSYSRQFIKNGENVFVISPSLKSTHMTDSSNQPVDEFNIKIGAINKWEDIMKQLNVKTRASVVKAINKAGFPSGVEHSITGNYAIVSDLHDIIPYMQFIVKYMPHIHTIFVGDFTHYITNEITGEVFRSRKSGGEAFAKYYDLAADALKNVIEAPDKLGKKNLVVVTEYHAKYDPEEDIYRIYVPAGNMLSEKIKPESYYDYILHTHVLDYDAEQDDTKRFKFVITKRGRYDGRMANLFQGDAKGGMIPNDMQLVLDKVRAKEGITV